VLGIRSEEIPLKRFQMPAIPLWSERCSSPPSSIDLKEKLGVGGCEMSRVANRSDVSVVCTDDVGLVGPFLLQADEPVYGCFRASEARFTALVLTGVLTSLPGDTERSLRAGVATVLARPFSIPCRQDMILSELI
jgi:hypothetical protein